MNKLAQIILEMMRSEGRQVRVLPGGLYLVFRPHAKDGRCRLVACRFQVWPSEAELRTLREALQVAFDNLGNRIAYDIAAEWERMPVTDDYAGDAIYWRLGDGREVMTADTETARKLQVALQQRKQRLLKREQVARPRVGVGAQTIRKGML